MLIYQLWATPRDTLCVMTRVCTIVVRLAFQDKRSRLCLVVYRQHIHTHGRDPYQGETEYVYITGTGGASWNTVMAIMAGRQSQSLTFLQKDVQGGPKKCITFTNKNFKHFVLKNYFSVGRRNLTAWSTHEYSKLSNFDTLQISSF